jgi:hypothetical protein
MAGLLISSTDTCFVTAFVFPLLLTCWLIRKLQWKELHNLYVGKYPKGFSSMSFWLFIICLPVTDSRIINCSIFEQDTCQTRAITCAFLDGRSVLVWDSTILNGSASLLVHGCYNSSFQYRSWLLGKIVWSRSYVQYDVKYWQRNQMRI